MTKNPFVSALLATAYIIAIASFLFYVPRRMAEEADNVLAPIMMLSLFVLSAAVMAYLFLVTPLELYFAGERMKALQFFGKTVVWFAGLTFVVVMLALFVNVG